MKRFSLYCLFFLALISCGMKRPTYYIGVDPAFYGSNFKGLEAHVFGFIDDLLREVGRVEGVDYVRVNANWDNLLLGLKQNRYQGAISSLLPSLLESRTYLFSQPLLQTGPVLVVRQTESIHSFADLNNKEIAVAPGSRGMWIMEAEPQVTLRTYDSISSALADLQNGLIDGAMIPSLLAMASIGDLYLGRLKIVTKPFGDEGLRIVTLKTESDVLIDRFNQGVERLVQEGEYQRLLTKWHLGFASTDKVQKGKKAKRQQ